MYIEIIASCWDCVWFVQLYCIVHMHVDVVNEQLPLLEAGFTVWAAGWYIHVRKSWQIAWASWSTMSSNNDDDAMQHRAVDR